MARTALKKTTATTPYPIAGVSLIWTPATVSDGNKFTMTGQELLLARNVHATDAKDVVITSVACSHGRTGNVTQALAAGAVRSFGPFKRKDGWVQSDGMLYVLGEDANVEFAVINMPALA